VDDSLYGSHPPYVGGYGTPPKLEVAMGLETVHPDVLPKLNKRMTLDQFARAAGFLRQHDIALRVFVLVKPPFLDESDAVEWARRSVAFAFDCGASVVSLIPTRLGNGSLETIATNGGFSPPKLATFEQAFNDALSQRRGRVFADTWDLERFSNCPACFAARKARLERMNFTQQLEPAVACPEHAESEFGAPT
jgi:radical SAM enzyme (TIGR01210 family)